MAGFKHFTHYDRREIESGLNQGLSFRRIAELLGRSPSSVAREVKVNRCAKSAKERRVSCPERSWCKRVSLCDPCRNPGAYCVGCSALDCRDVCPSYIAKTGCVRLDGAPWICNGCRKNRYGCNRSNRYVYTASVAHATATERRSSSRRGVDRTQEDMEYALGIIRSAISRGMSPYEISVAYAEECHVSPSTLYRWVEAGYGGMANIDLARKVGFRPRKRPIVRKTTGHGKQRSWDAFCELPDEMVASACEMDCVIGRKTDTKVLLTLYMRPSHLQLAFLLEEHTCKAVTDALDGFEALCGKEMFSRMMPVLLTDNGHEFEDTLALERSIFLGKRTKAFYCDPRQSQQKARCEKAHCEIRQILPKQRAVFDDLDAWDVSVISSQVNSTPRASLCGMNPIRMFKTAYGQEGRELLDALGIEEVDRDELVLKPEILDIERNRRSMGSPLSI